MCLDWFSSHGPVFLNDLLPLAYDDETLKRVCEHIDQVQTRLQRPMLLENPSTYLQFQCSTLEETDFISEAIRRTGCGLLLDVNNVYVSCINHQQDPLKYIESLPLHAVGEIHLAGFAEDTDSLGDRLLIDDHGAPIDNAVWQLYQHVLTRTGPVATLKRAKPTGFCWRRTHEPPGRVYPRLAVPRGKLPRRFVQP